MGSKLLALLIIENIILRSLAIVIDINLDALSVKECIIHVFILKYITTK
jgi:hypothetical protein